MTNTTRVSIVRCESYDREKVRAALDRTFSCFGGIHTVIKKGTKVLLKPNFIKESAPETCDVTHPVVIEAAAKMVLEAGATPVIGDSPAFGAVSQIAKRLGIDRFAEENGVEIIELDAPRRVKSFCGKRRFVLTVSGKALDVDAIINLPKLKAHGQLLYTAAVKNMYGCVCGKRKAWRHFQSKNDLGWYTEMLLANYHAVKPVFTIVDAVMAMEKRGPTGGEPRQVSLLFGGADGIAIDRVIAEVIDVSPSRVPILQTAKIHNIGEQNLEKIEIAGEPVSSVKVPGFVLPELSPIGFSATQVVRSLIRHLLLKSFGKATACFLSMCFLLPAIAFSEPDRAKNFPPQVALDDIIHVPTGTKVPFSGLPRFFDAASVFYVGESHANMASHQVQLKVLKAFYERFGNNVAIGMEMFTRPYQPFLDQWVSGEIDEKKFVEETHWDTEWGYDYTLYKDIMDFAREKKIPIIALNAPKALVKMVSKKGLKDLSEEEKKQLPDMDTSDFFHKVYLEKALPGHGNHVPDLEKYNDVQSLWEEYMAQTIVNYLSSWEGKDKKFLAFAGNGHIIYDFGIPKRVFRRAFLPYYTLYPTDFPGDKPSPEQDMFLPNIPLEPADFVWVIPPQSAQKRIYLGVQLQKGGDSKLVIQEISHGSPAEKAGFAVGDAVLAIDGRDVQSVVELVHYLQTKKFGDTCAVDVDRAGMRVSLSVELFEMGRE